MTLIKIKRSVLSLLDDSNKDTILKCLPTLKEINNQVLDDILNHINEYQFESLIQSLKPEQGIYQNRIQDCFDSVENYLREYLKINNQYLTTSVCTKCKNGKMNPLILLKIKNESQLFILDRFNIPIYDENEIDMILNQLPYELLEKINSKDIKRVMKEITINEDNSLSKSEQLLLAVRLYLVFGLDNALKVINQKFSLVTGSLLQRAGEINFIDRRRQYRLEHQNEFYSYELLTDIQTAILNDDVDFIIRIVNLDYSEARSILEELKQKYENENYGIPFLSNWLKDSINKREECIKELYIEDFIRKNSKKLGRNKISYQIMNRFFADVDVTKFQLDQSGKIVPNKSLVKFLLGNTKADNDCTLRLVFNQMALGLNNNIARIINRFEDIEKVMKKSSTMKMESILDVIDINKVLLYELAPNEQGITLETITRIYNSHKFCTESSEEIVRRVKELYHAQKYRISSSIPIISGRENGISYQVMDFQSDKLLSCGIEAGSCFKVGGKGEEFLKYCILNPQGAVILLKDKNQKEYICQIVRKGNTIYANGIDPKEMDQEKNQKLMDTLEIIFSRMATLSQNYQPIELAIITDLDRETFFENSNYQQRDINFVDSFYSDLGKKDKKFYALFQKEQNVKEIKYEAEDIYKIERPSIYECVTELEEDKERLELLINSINYDSIEFMNISKKEKNSMRRRFKPINLGQYKYIIGNKDWYIAITDLGITSAVLPYDKRAMIEMKEVLNSKNFRNILNQNVEQENKKL